MNNYSFTRRTVEAVKADLLVQLQIMHAAVERTTALMAELGSLPNVDFSGES